MGAALVRCSRRMIVPTFRAKQWGTVPWAKPVSDEAVGFVRRSRRRRGMIVQTLWIAEPAASINQKRQNVKAMQIDVAIIGGTGVGSRLAELPGQSLFLPTAGGPLRGRVIKFGGSQVLAIQRHAAGHAKPPHKVAYAAFTLGLKALGIKHCLSTAAVGSLRTDWPIGTIVACTDFIDASGRNLTLFDSKVQHTPMDHPFTAAPASSLRQALIQAGIEAPEKAVYLQANGPRYETSAEILAFAREGADIVGMTAASEATLMREAGIRYECLAVVTNLAAGLGTEIDHGAVGDVMKDNASPIFKILDSAVGHLTAQCGQKPSRKL